MQKIAIVTGNPNDVVTGTTSDTAQSLVALGASISTSPVNQVSGGRQANYAIISVEGYPIRYGKGSVSTSLGHPAEPGDEIKLESADEVLNCKFISAVAGNHATLQITVEYRE